jgi:hypothetical protein
MALINIIPVTVRYYFQLTKGGNRMDYSLEKIDQIRERTGLGYAAARQLLTDAQGDVLEALVMSEDEMQEDVSARFGRMAAGLLEPVKRTLSRSNRLRLKLKKEEGTVLEIPATLGLAGALLAPKLAAVGAVALLLANYRLEVQRPEETDLGENNYRPPGAES